MNFNSVDSIVSDKTGLSLPYRELCSLIDSIPALVASIDCNMIMRFSNKTFNQWFSIRGDVSGRSFPLVVGKAIFDQLQRHMGRVLVGERVNFQISLHTRDGFQCLDATLSPEFDREGSVAGFIFHSSDITQKRKTERDLKDYFENASISLHWVNAEGVILWANPAELRMLGYTESEYVGHHISEFYVDKVACQDVLDRLANRKLIRNYETEMLCRDGSTRYVTINSSVLWEGDKFVHTRCFTIDNTEQKLAAKAVKESEERFKMMANLVPLVIWTTDEKGNCNFLSVKWQEITGKKMEEGLGEGWQKMIHPEDLQNIRRSWRKSVAAKKSFEAKFRYENSAGGYDVTYANSSPRYTAAGEFDGYIGIFQDITSEEQIRSSLERLVVERTEDLKKRNTALRVAEKTLMEKNIDLERMNNELSSFAHIASHDLQEPLRKIQTFTFRLQDLEKERLSPQGLEFIERIQDSSGRMRSLIKDLLDYSMSSKAGEKSEPVDLNLIFNDVVAELEIKIQERQAVIVNSGLPRLNGIRFQFHQLFLNIIANALKFSKSDVAPHVEVSSELVTGDCVPDGASRTDAKYHYIRIADDGIGFDPRYSEAIFEIFNRLHGRIKFDGTGIGLAICKKIVDNHRGKIAAEGRVGHGATFHIYLPADAG